MGIEHLTEDDLVLYRYQESPDAAAVERHLAACQQCRTEYEALERVLCLLEKGLLETGVPEPPPSYERDVWIGVQQRLAEPQSAWRQFGSWFRARLREPLAVHAIPATPPASWLRASWFVPQATLAALIVALLVGSFAIDRVLQPVPSKPVPVVGSLLPAPSTGVTARDRVLIAAVGEHLQRSEMMLTEFNNADTLASSIDLRAQQAEAEDLINENRLYRQSAAGVGQAQMASLLDDLERVLIEVAHAPASASPEELERMRTRLDTRDVLFKVRVAGAGLRAREDVAAVVAPSMSESGSGL